MRQGRRPIAWGALRAASLGFTLALISASLPASAQGVDCTALRAEIDASSSGASRAGQFADAIRQQQYEMQRAQAYADSIGCNNGFLFGGGTAECEGLAARLERMQNNIAQLQQQAQGAGDGGERRRALVEQYNGYCADGRSDGPVQDQRIMPVDPDAPPFPGSPDETASPAQTESKVLCVRHCDGGFFPVA